MFCYFLLVIHSILEVFFGACRIVQTRYNRASAPILLHSSSVCCHSRAKSVWWERYENATLSENTFSQFLFLRFYSLAIYSWTFVLKVHIKTNMPYDFYAALVRSSSHVFYAFFIWVLRHTNYRPKQILTRLFSQLKVYNLSVTKQVTLTHTYTHRTNAKKG